MIEKGFHAVPRGQLATVVTHLEMTTAPASLTVHPIKDFTLQNLDNFAPDTYRALFRRIGGDYLWFSRLRLSDAELMSILQAPDYDLYGLQSASGETLGLLELDFREETQCELAYFGLDRSLIGQGAGRFLMQNALQRAWQEPIARLHVHTCTLDSAQALPFYIKSGFKPYKQEIEVADDPRAIGELPVSAAPQIPFLP